MKPLLKTSLILLALAPFNIISASLLSGGYPMVAYSQQISNQISIMGIGFVMGYAGGLHCAILNTTFVGLLHFSNMGK